MPSYITVHRAARPERLSPLIALAESLLDRPIAAGVTIRNVAVVPRRGRVYVHAEAPAPASLDGLFEGHALAPISITEADSAEWSA